MEILFSILSVLFIGLVIATAFAFGVIMLVWIVVVAVTVTLVIIIREKIRRWLFMRQATPRPSRQEPKVIEAEYRDISE